MKKYYAAIAGNVTYCLGIFDATGKLISPASLNTKFDIRGLWYNSNSKTLQMNGYNDFGWGEYKLNSKGLPDTVKLLHEGMNQPGEQSVGAFNPLKKQIYFLNEEGNLDVYNFNDGTYQDAVELTLGRTKKDDDDADAALTDNDDVVEDYNTTVVFTGIPGSEIGLLNHTQSQVELYNLKDGHLVRKLALPDDAPINNFLNFSYSNGVWWLFDKDERAWKGYK